MRAVIQNSVGGPEVLVIADRPAPSPNAGEVLIRVGASPASIQSMARFAPAAIRCSASRPSSSAGTFREPSRR